MPEVWARGAYPARMIRCAVQAFPLGACRDLARSRCNAPESVSLTGRRLADCRLDTASLWEGCNPAGLPARGQPRKTDPNVSKLRGGAHTLHSPQCVCARRAVPPEGVCVALTSMHAATSRCNASARVCSPPPPTGHRPPMELCLGKTLVGMCTTILCATRGGPARCP